MQKYKVRKLKNGCNSIIVPVKGTKAVTILALFPVGSRYEKSNIAGASHFVEHLMFKGTQKRPTALDISRQLEAVGAEYNAFTSKDYTGYYIKVDGKQQKLAFDILSDMLFNSKFEKSEVERERGVIVEELRMYEDNPTMSVDQLADQNLFGDHPLGRDIGGSIQTVKQISRDSLYDYYKKYYNPANMVVVVSGAVVSGKQLNSYLSYFEQAGSTQKKSNLVRGFKKFQWGKKVSKEKRIMVKKRKLDQAHVILNFPGIRYNEKNKYAAAILTNILGMGMNSRLFVEVRERRGLAYMVRAGMEYHRDVGTFYIQSGLDPARLPQALEVIVQELEKIKNEKVSVKELKEAKSNILGRMSLASEDSSTLADWFAKQFWFSTKIIPQSVVASNLKKVTAEQVQKVAKTIFDIDKMHVSVIGALTKEKVIKMIK